MEKFPFSGKITKVSADGRSAVVTLDYNVEGRHLVVITPDTRGRVRLMNGVGQLEENTFVSGQSIIGPDSMRAVEVNKT